MKNKFFGEKNQNYLFLGMSLLIVINFYTIFYLYTLNLPLTDDVYDIFYYAIANQENSGFINKLKLLIWQYDEHKLVFNHLVYLSSFAIFNKINLIFINSIGLIALPALLFFIFHALNKNQKTPFAFMILAAMIFNFSHNEVTFWAMATLNAYFIPLMAVICFYFLTKTKHIHIIFASSLMFVSVISMPNGVLIFLLGVPLIIMAQEKKNILIFLCYWLAAGIVALLIFFTGMEGFKSLSQIESGQLINLYRQSSLIILGMLVLLGGLPFTAGDNVLYAVILGLASLVMFGFFFLLRKRLSLKLSVPLNFFWLFCLMSLGLCAVFRVPLNGIEYGALASRYKILTCIVWAIPLCVLASACLENKKSGIIRFFVFMIALIFFVISNHRGIEQIDLWNKTKKRDYSNWTLRGDQLSIGMSGWYNFTHEIFSESIRRELYTPFTVRGIDFQPVTFEKIDFCPAYHENVNSLHSGASHIEKALAAKIAFIDKGDVIKYVSFCSAGSYYLAKLRDNSWTDITYKKKKLIIDSRWFSPGSYEILFLDDEKNFVRKGAPSLQIKNWSPEYNCDESQMNYLPARKVMVRTICQPYQHLTTTK